MGSELEGTVTFSQASIFFAKPKAFQKTLAKMGMKKMSEVVVTWCLKKLLPGTGVQW